MKFVYFLVWCWEWFGDLLLICWCCIPCCKLRFGIKMVISSFFVWACNLHCTWDMVVVIGCTISRVVSRAAIYIIFRGTYRAPRRLLLLRVVSCAAIDEWVDMSPMGPRLRDSVCVSLGQTCIIILDIALQILIISELDIVFCWSCDCLSAELVIFEYGACYGGYVICCCWGYLICESVVVEDR